MKMVFVIAKYFPFGGLQRDFLKLAQTAVARGHQVEALVMAWQGPKPQELNVRFVSSKGLSNHARIKYFSEKVLQCLSKMDYDYVVGFNRLPGLDAYFSGDSCFYERMLDKHSRWARFLPRYSAYYHLEKSVFAKGGKTKVIVINNSEKAIYQKHYQTEDDRFYQIAPAIEKQAKALSVEQKIAMRKLHKIPDDAFWLLLIGSHFEGKGVDRALAAMKSIPQKTVLTVVGSGDAKQLASMAKQQGLQAQVKSHPATEETMSLMAGADLLIHPARVEAGGKVLVEALLSHLPVLTTAACGYAYTVEEVRAGEVVPEPFSQDVLNQKLKEMLQLEKLMEYQRHAKNNLNIQQFYDVYDKLITQFERWAKNAVRS